MPADPPPRLLWLDALRALATIAVVGIHVSNGTLLHPELHSPGELFALVLLDRTCRFAVPAFLIVSGLSLGLSQSRRPLPYGAFLKRRAFRLLPPYCLWTLVYVLLDPGGRSAGELGLRYLRCLFLADASFHTYFVFIIGHVYLFFPLLDRLTAGCRRTRRGSALLAVGAFATATWTVDWLPPQGWHAGAPDAVSGYLLQLQWTIFRWLPYVVMGLAAVPWLDELVAWRPRREVAILLAGASAAALVALSQARFVAWGQVPEYTATWQDSIFGWANPSTPWTALAALTLLLPLLWRADAASLTRLAPLGRAAYGVYLAHVAVLQLLLRWPLFRLLTVLAGTVPMALLAVVGLTLLLVRILAATPILRVCAGVDHSA